MTNRYIALFWKYHDCSSRYILLLCINMHIQNILIRQADMTNIIMIDLTLK